MKNSIKSRLLTMGMTLFALCAFADPATGWKQTAAGTYNYNDAENWVGGAVNGVFGSDLAIEGAQTITFSADTQLPNGLSIAQTGAFAITFASDDASAPRTLTLGGGYTNNGAGDVAFDASVVLDLGGDTRTLTSAKKLTLSCVVQNGGVVFDGAGAVVVNGANTYAGGTTLNGSGTVYQANASAFGTGRFTFGEGSKLCARVSSFATAVPITLAGSFTWTTDQKKNQNMGNGDITILKPLTASIESGYTLTLGGQVAADSPCDISAIAKSGNGSLTTSASLVVPEGTTKTLNVGQYNWYWSGVISGAGTLRKTGNGLLQTSTSVSNPEFTGRLVIEAGSVRFMGPTAIGTGGVILIEKGGTLRTNTSKECGYAYSAAKMLRNDLIDPLSTGCIGLASDETELIDLTKAPGIVLAPTTDNNRTLAGISAVSADTVIRLGGGGKTLIVNGTLPECSGIDASTGSVQFNASQPDVDGTVTIGPGYTLTIGSSVELPDADIVAEGGTVRFAAATEGTFVRARSVTLNKGILRVDSPANGGVIHRIFGALKTGVYGKGTGGISTVELNNDSVNDSALQVGAIASTKGVEMLHVKRTATGSGALKLTVDDTTGLALTGTGATGTIYAPVSPFVRMDNSLATYDSVEGLRPLSSSEYETFSAPDDEFAVTSGANVYVNGSGTLTFSASAGINSLHIDGDVVVEGGDQVVLSVNSGAIDVTSSTSAEINVPLAFGNIRGFISGEASKKYYLKSAISGTAGLTIAELNTGIGSTGAILYGTGCTYTGDTYLFGYFAPKTAADFFPHGQDRDGDVYLYGKMVFNGGSVKINALNGSGSVTCEGTTGSSMYMEGSTDGDYTGTFVNNATGANFTMYKTGSGKQRFSDALGWKYSFTIENGEFQVDGSISVNRNQSVLTVAQNGVLSGCGAIHANSRIDLKGRIVPGSDDLMKGEMRLRQTMTCYSGCTMSFQAGKDYATQLLCEKAVNGSGVEIPVTVSGNGSGKFKLIEAPSIEPTFVKAAGSSSGRLIRIAAADSESGNEELWLERTSGLFVIFR